jgi:hypothetical protein
MNALLLAALAVMTPPCYACGPGYSAPVYAPAYTAASDWKWSILPDGTYRKYRSVGGHIEWDSQVYSRDTAGNYHPYVKQLGQTVYGYHEPHYRAAQELGYLPAKYLPPSILKQLSEPAPLNPRDFLPIVGDDAVDREAGTKALELAIRQKSDVDRAAIDARAKRDTAQLELSRQAMVFNQYERMQQKNAEILALLQQQTAITASGQADGPTLPIADKQLHAVVVARCYECHGGKQGVKKGVDFRQKLSAEVWAKSVALVCLGEMPQGGQPLSSEEVKLFRAAMNAAQ